MKTYSLDLRERVYRAYWQREGTVSQIAQTFEVSEGFIYKLRRQEQALGHVEPMPHRGGNPPVLKEEQEALLCQWIREKPDSTLEELAELLVRHQKVKPGLSTLSRVLAKLGLARKKKELCGLRTQ